VPAEAWVGAPIATTGGATKRADVTAELQSLQTQRHAAPQAWVGTLASANIATGALKRSEVVADTNLALRAGLGNYTTRIYYEPFSAEEARRTVQYFRMRSGPEYVAEVARLESGGLRLTQTAQAN